VQAGQGPGQTREGGTAGGQAWRRVQVDRESQCMCFVCWSFLAAVPAELTRQEGTMKVKLVQETSWRLLLGCEMTHHDSVALCCADVQCCALVIITNVNRSTRTQQAAQQLWNGDTHSARRQPGVHVSVTHASPVPSHRRSPSNLPTDPAAARAMSPLQAALRNKP
jgi:hypothetical protein